MTRSRNERKNLLFYSLWIAIPVIQFVIFYIFVNFNSILLVFQSYDLDTGYKFVGFDTLKYTFNMIFNEPTESIVFATALKNSLILLAASLIVGIPCSLLFSYYIYKKFFGSKFFRVILFLPSILSVVVMVAIFRNFVDVFIPDILYELFGIEFRGFLSDPNTRFGTLIFYNIFVSFGSSTLLYSSSMSAIPPSQIEAAKIDGASWWDEFIHVIVPSIYPTIVVFLVVTVAGIFTNQMGLYSFYQLDAEFADYTLGYYLYKRTVGASGYTDYPYLACLGIYFSIIVIPLTFAVRFLLNKFGPSTEQ